MYINHNVGCVTAREKYMRNLFLIGSFILLTGCSEFALLISAGSIGASQNAYARAYNGMDILTLMSTDKSIKKHIYDKGKKIYDEGREIYDGR